MMIRELINKFFAGQSSVEETRQVIQYFHDHPEEWEEHLREEEWEQFDNIQRLSADVTKTMLGNVKARAFPAVRIIKRLAVAASIILMLGLGWKYFLTTHTPAKIADVGRSAAPEWKHRLNKGPGNVSFDLSDGTNIEMMPNSELTYPEPFGDQKREVFLQGQALFNAAKGESKPFIVHSDAISTTVLGTRFLVTSFSDQSVITVRLLEGKVRVQAKLSGDVFLIPGEELVYDKSKMTASIHSISGEHLAQKPPENAAHTLSAKWVSFDNEALAGVFEQLQRMYNVRIEYSKEDVRKMAFIGKIDRTDSLERVLHIICSLNNLSLQRHGDVFVIKKG